MAQLIATVILYFLAGMVTGAMLLAMYLEHIGIIPNF